ncbi:MAG: hypothetical protein LBK58_11800 [Prevotellaceae bacterium]|jgi:hypothetical protein|nr:hypothetical protein [Prevotellaceae bacterium]
MQNIIESHKDKINYATCMTKYLYDKHIKIFDYAQFAESYKYITREAVLCIAD